MTNEQFYKKFDEIFPILKKDYEEEVYEKEGWQAYRADGGITYCLIDTINKIKYSINMFDNVICEML